MKEDIEDMSETILRICQSKPWTRGCYWRLYYEYLLETGVAFTSKRSGYFIPFKHLDDMPSPESVSRTYRELRKTHPEIKPVEKIQEYREQNEVEMRAINSWFPVLDGKHPKQTVLLE